MFNEYMLPYQAAVDAGVGSAMALSLIHIWFKSGDSRSFQIAKNLDIFNSIVNCLLYTSI